MRRRVGFITLGALFFVLSVSAQDAPEPFAPFQRLGRAYRLVNGVSFSPDGKQMFFALLHREVLVARGQTAAADAPEVAAYESSWNGQDWSEPTLLPFSGKWKDYEPVMAPDGVTLVFQSPRPRNASDPPSDQNNLWMVKREGSGWSAPVELTALNGKTGGSYSTVARDGSIFFLRGDDAGGGKRDYNIYHARKQGSGFAAPVAVPSASGAEGEGDPWVAPGGEFLIFTRFQDADWQKTCDLYITFFANGKWSTAVPLADVNTPGPDYSASTSPDQQWLYYRAGGRFMKRPLAPVLANARKAAGL